MRNPHALAELELIFTASMEDLRTLLGEAIDHLDKEEHLAAIGALALLDDHVETVRAALLLFRQAAQERRRRK